jgi:Ribbon-helix-helix protein, copG family
MALVLTQVYLEPKQKKELAAKAKATGRKSSDLVREAVDGLLLGVSPVELAQLDEATKRAEIDIKAMVKALDANAKDHKAFMAEIAKLRASPKAS